MYVYGKNVANEMLDDNKKINQVFVMYNFKEKELLDKINRKHIPVKELPKVELDKKVPGLHQGIILDIPDYQYASLDDVLVNENPLLVILDHIVDPHNLGAIIRTCEAAGVDGIIIPKDRSVSVNGTVLKTSVGTAERMKIVEVSNIVNVIKKLKKDGFWIVGTDMDGTDYTKIDYRGKCARKL